MKKNAYTTAVHDVHAPSSAIEKALQYAKQNTFGNTEEESRRSFPIGRLSIAAAIALMIIGAAVIYSIFITPVSRICLDSRESVTITLNSRGNVLSAPGYPELSGKPAEDAIAVIAEDMIGSGALTASENTLILGVSNNASFTPRQLAEGVQKAFDEEHFNGCVLALTFEKSTQTRYHQSASRTCLIELLHSCDNSLSVENLKELSSNSLCLLLKDTGSNAFILTGAPSESAYIGFDGAVQKALALSGFKETELSDISVAYSIYHGRLIYLVRLNAGENSEAYFINAITGATEQAIKAPTEDIDTAVEEAIHSPSIQTPTEKPTYAAEAPTASVITQSPTVPATEPTADANQPPYEDRTNAPQDPLPTAIPDVCPTTTPLIPTQAPTTAESAEYLSISITLKELSFVVLSPPQSAAAVGYQTLFEGQYIETRKGDKNNCGEVAVITNFSQLQAFLKKHSYAYTDKNGNTFKNDITKDFFKNRYILVSACTVSDASYYTTVTKLSTDGGMLYMENSLCYGTAHSGEFYCRTLSLYAVDRSEACPELPITVY